MGKRVLVTGAAGGIGDAMCGYFAERGWAVAAHARTEEKARAVAGRRQAVPVWADLTQSDELDALAEQVMAGGGLDLLVHNAGVLTRSKAFGPHGLGLHAEVNVVAPFELTRRLAEHMVATGNDPTVVVVSSSAANFARAANYEVLAEPDGSSLFGQYALSKSAANAIVRKMAERWRGLRVLATEPGFSKTAMTAGNSSMPALMRWMAHFAAISPEKATKRCFDAILNEAPPSGSIVQSGKVTKPGAVWEAPDAAESLQELFSRGGIAI